jgi:Right handed beta helix region
LSIDGKVTIENCTYNGFDGCAIYCTDWDPWNGGPVPTAVTAEFLIQNNTFTGNWYGVLFYKQAESSSFSPKANIQHNMLKDNDIGVGVFCDIVSAGDYVVEQNVIRGNVGLVVYGLAGTMASARTMSRWPTCRVTPGL